MTEALTLAIETSNPSAAVDGFGPGVALGRGGSVIGSVAIAPGERHDDQLMPAIAGLCERAGVSPAELGRVAVSVGPGGLTGLRIAVAAAAAMGESLGIECVGVPTSDVASALAEPGGAFGVVLSTKNERAWLAVYDEPGGPARWARECDAGSLGGAVSDAGVARLLCDSHLPESWCAEASGLGIALVRLRLSAAGCLLAAEGRSGVEPGGLGVLYAREPEAATAWRALHGREDR